MQNYLDQMRDIVENGTAKGDRTGTGTISVFGRQLRWDLSKGFPLVTTKRIHMKSVIHELIWFLSGSTNIKYLQDNGVRIWDEWADENGELGPVYGSQWRAWRDINVIDIAGCYDGEDIDQISNVIESIKNNPNSRRHIVSAWNVAEVPRMALPPCHLLFQFDVSDGKLSCQMYIRSWDYFLGGPFNIASYALLTHMIAQQCDLEVGDLIISSGDTHLYQNHKEQVAEQLTREPKALPKLIIKRRPDSIFEYKYEDFEIVGYEYHPTIKAPIAV